MAFCYKWLSLHGALTDDNRDHCGIAERPDATLHVVIDGSTRGPHGGDLARDLTRCVVDGFLALDQPLTKQRICDLLRQAHGDLRRQYPTDSASYFIAVQTESKPVMTFHAGDCRLGRVKQDRSIEWLSGIHTLANAITELSDMELVDHPDRHLLTRSFRPRRFQQPECKQFSLSLNDTLLIATDGFWAEMDAAKQADFLEGKNNGSGQRRDDRSCLLLRQKRDEPVETATKMQRQENLYIRSKRNGE